MIIALRDRFLFLEHVRQVVVHAPAPHCEVSVIYADGTTKRYDGMDAERIVDCLASQCDRERRCGCLSEKD
jgi:hypothetical protein